ncbi:MAG: glycosyltransferase family 2 protein [Thermoleophilaceae bacterium]
MPEISVVIPTLRRYDQLSRVLGHLERQEIDPNAFEVVVVSDAKEGNHAAVASAVGNRRYRVRRLAASVPGASSARNRGWRAAEGFLILFLDNDVLPIPQLLREHLAWHRRHPEQEAGVLGHVEWARELRVTPFMRWLDQGFQFGYGSIEGQEARWWHLYTANVSLKRALLERANGFDEDAFPFGYEDLDLGRRMEPLGFRLLYNRAARAEHLHACTLDEWRGTVARIAGAEYRFVRRYPDFKPFFLSQLTAESPQSALQRVTARLAGVVPREVPWLGPRVWASARARYRRELAPHFLEAWDRAFAADRAGPG